MFFKLLADNARLVSFASGETAHRHGMFITDVGGETHKLTEFDSSKGSYIKESSKYDLDNKILYNAFDKVVLENNEYDLFVLEEKNGHKHFCVSIYDNDQKLIKTFDDKFIAAPMLIYMPSLKNYFLVSQIQDNVIEFFEIGLKGLTKKDSFKITGANLYKYHSSGIVDLYANLKPLLALEICDPKGVNVLSIYKITNDSIEFIDSVDLESKISPIQFVQSFDNKFGMDVWFMKYNQTKNKAEMVVLKNKIVPVDKLKNIGSIYNAQSYIDNGRQEPKNGDKIFEAPAVVMEFSEEMKEISPERYERFHVGDFATDGTMHFMFLTKEGKMIIKELGDNYELKDDTTEMFNEFLTSNVNEKIGSVTSADIGNDGKQLLIISKEMVNNVSSQIATISFKIVSVNNKIELGTYFQENNSPFYIYGSSFLVGLNNGYQRCLYTQSTQPSYASLQQKGVFVGVGATHFSLTFLFVSLPFTDFNESVLVCEANIFPTTITTLTFVNNTLQYRCFFNSPHLHLVTIILFVFLLLALSLIFVLSFQERKRYRIKTENDSIQKLMKMI